MKTLAGCFLSVVLGFLPAAGQRAEKEAGNQPAPPGARIEVSPEVYDFGKVKQQQKLDTEFVIKNAGSEDLTIGRISTSCGCTAALTAEKVVKPGKTTTLKVTLETREYEGPIERSVSIASNDPKRIKTIKVKAFVEATAGQR